jgi:hypothetical protein
VGLHEQIFERLFQASDPGRAGRQGLGLGLHICKELVTRQGGRVWAENAVPHGAVLSVTLPVFSMRNLLAPALRATGAVPGPLTLLVAHIVAGDGWVSDTARAEHSQAARELLEHCLQSELDVLLPKMGSSGSAELFFAVIAADAAGTAALAARVHKQFEERELEQKAGLKISTSCHAVETSPEQTNDPNFVPLESLAIAVQGLVNDELTSRKVANAH